MTQLLISPPKRANQLLHQYFTFKIGKILIDLIIWSYYYILLYQQTGTTLSLLIESLINHTGIWIGFIIGSFLLDKLGYLKSFRLSFVVQIISFILILLTLNNLADYFIPIALVRGVAGGLYWPIEHSFKLKEVRGSHRGAIIGSILSLIQLLKILIPILVGSLISLTDNYLYIFILGIVIELIIISIPFKYNKRTRSKINSDEFVRILKNKRIGIFIFLTSTSAGFKTLYSSLFLIIPYLIIGDEFGVGALLSFAGIAAALLTFRRRRAPLRDRVKLGIISYTIIGITTAMLGFIWSVPAIILRSLGSAFSDSLGDSARDDLDYRIREKILGKFRSESTVELNIITETSYWVGKVVVLMIFIALLSINVQLDAILQLTLIITAPSFLLIFLGFLLVNTKIKPQEFEDKKDEV